jgi:hypothetical protein
MKSGPTWVERGPDGHSYFIRKKTKLPQSPQQKRSLPFVRAFKRNFHILPDPARISLAMMPPPPIRAQTESNLVYQRYLTPPYPPQPYSINICSLPHQPPGNQDPSNNGNQEQQFGMLKPPMQSFPSPHPMMYPMALYPPQLGCPLLPHSAYHFNPSQSLHRQGVYPTAPLPAGARIFSPIRLPAADMKCKCRIYGRFRSSGYHYKHPIAPGELPAETLCQQCQEEATDSEDDSLDSRFEGRRRHSRFWSRSRVPAVVVTDPSRRSQGRSQSRVKFAPCNRSCMSGVHDRRYSTASSRSSSLDVELLHISVDDDHRYRRRSPSVRTIEHVQHIEDAPIRRWACTEETSYNENSPGRRRQVYEDEFYDCDRRYDYPLRLVTITRLPTL